MILDDLLHIIPLDDYREHVESENCWCHPSIDDDNGLAVHHAMDGREQYESGALRLQ